MEKSKENKGITLVALIVLIIVMAILITTAIYTGVGTVRYTRFMRIKTEMETLQASVNSWYEKYINGDESVLNYGETVNYSEYDKEFVYVLADEEAAQNYKLYTAEYIKNTLGIDGIEYDYLISIKDRMVVLVDGLIYQGKLYYIPDDFDLKNVEAHEPIFSADFNLVCGRNPKDLKQEVIFIYGIKFYDNGREINMSKFDIEYSTDGINWTTVSSANSKTEYNGNTAYIIYTKDDGTYNVRIKDRNGNIITRTDNTEKSIEVVNCSFPSFNNNDWQIYSVRQLRFLAEFVNNAYTTVGNEKLTKVLTNSGHVEAEIKELTESSWIYLMNDLDLGARPGPGDTDEDRWETEANEKVKWEPIGNTIENTLKASFDGQNHKIKGAYVNIEDNLVGIFGASYSLKNLTVENGYIKGNINIGGVLGSLRLGKIENCHNKNVTVIMKDNSVCGGGVIGHSKGIVEKCSNTGTVIAGKNEDGASEVGGIVGYLSNQAKAIECTNEGTIIGYGYYVGGIAGVGKIDNIISNCINKGTIKGKNGYIGGIVGGINSNTTITSCSNSGVITGEGEEGIVGGIIGNTNIDSKIVSCRNSGTVTGEGERVGGIIGWNFKDGQVTDCHNSGTVSGKNKYTGGIAGRVDNNNTITSCSNSGTVTGKSEGVGGTAGCVRPNSTITECNNSGMITGNDMYTGGIVGLLEYTDSANSSKVEKCYNKGVVDGETDVGGIVGSIGGSAATATVINCYNKGNISGTEKVGSVIGYQTNTSGGNILNNLYYLSTLALGAINGVDDAANNIRSTTDDFPDLESFLSALNSGTIN